MIFPPVFQQVLKMAQGMEKTALISGKFT